MAATLEKFSADSCVKQDEIPQKQCGSSKSCREWKMKEEWKPNVILHINPSQQTRFEDYLRSKYSYDKYVIIILLNCILYFNPSRYI